MYRKFVFMCVVLSLLSYLLTGCAIKPEEDVYLNPIVVGQEQPAGAKSVTMSDEDVSITASALSAADLLTVSSDPNINPYIDVNGNVAKPLYTVFNITVKNNRSAKIVINPALAVLIDENGTQYEAIPFDTFKLRFPAVDTEYYYSPGYPYYWWNGYPFYNLQEYKSDNPADVLNVKLISDDDKKGNERGGNRGQVGEGNENRGQVREGNMNRDSGRGENENSVRGRDEGDRRDRGRTYYYYGNRYDNCDDWGDCYWDWDWDRNMPRSYYRYQSSSYYKKAIAQKTLLAQTSLYPEGAKSGFLAFPLLSPEAGKLKIIIPVTIYNGQSKTIHFQFQFQKTPAVMLEKGK